jgi:hypothetical protein
MTLEKNHSILDGSLSHFTFDIDFDIAFLSSNLSDESGVFSNTFVKGVFSSPQAFAGLTLNFGPNYPEKINVEYFLNSQKILSKDFFPDNTEFFVSMPTIGCTSFQINFLRSRFPKNYARLEKILFGKILIFSDLDIISCKIFEETDKLTNKTANDICEITLYSETDEFNIVEPHGIYSYLAPKQKFEIEEIIQNDNEEPIIEPMGVFYLDTWESLQSKQIMFKLLSPLGVLDKSQFKDGGIYTNIRAADALGHIFLNADWTDFIIDDELKNVIISGFIPICSHKEALSQIVFSLNAAIDDSRNNFVKIRQIEPGIRSKLNFSKIFPPLKITKNEFISGVLLTTHNYTKKPGKETVFNGFLTNGNHEIFFETPCSDFEFKPPDSIKLITENFNYILVFVDKSETYEILANKYEDIQNKRLISTNNFPQVQRENIVTVDDAFFVNDKNVEEIGKNLLKYYQTYDLTAEFKFFLESEKTGTNLVFLVENGRELAGYLLNQNIDLSGGFLSNAKILAASVKITNFYCCGEFFAGENFGAL